MTDKHAVAAPALTRAGLSRPGAARLAAVALVILFWAISVWQLERFPPLHGDEPWILAPGYKLAFKGTFGSDLFAGYAGMGEHYLQFLPLFSVLQGVVVRALGLGVFQMRYLPVVAGTLTVALTFRLGRALAGERTALLAALLLLGWRWAPGSHRFFGSGIPLLDITRVARFDILVAPLELAALWAAWRLGQRPDWRLAALTGLLAGLAGLTHVMGVFWIGIVLLWVWAQPGSGRARLRRTAVALGAAGLVMLPWALVVAGHWSDFLAQHRAVSRPWLEAPGTNFYLSSLIEEPRRYLLQLRQPLTYARPGVWLLLAGVPLAALQLVRRARPRRAGDPPGWATWAWLAAIGLVPLALALVVVPKNFGYLAGVAPMLCLTVAWAWQRGHWWRRAGARLTLALVLIEGVGGMAHLHVRARQLGSPAAYLRALREALPPGRIVGPSTAWLGLTDRDYAFNYLAYLWAQPPEGEVALTYTEAFDRLAPDLMLVDAGPVGQASSLEGWAGEIAQYAHTHSTRLLATVIDPEGRRIEIYEFGTP